MVDVDQMERDAREEGKVVIYLNNRIDAASVVEPEKLVEEFFEAIDAGGYESPGRGIEFALRWFISGPEPGLSSAWNEVDWDAIVAALWRRFEADRELERRVRDWALGITGPG